MLPFMFRDSFGLRSAIAALLVTAASASAQTPPPIPGVTGTLALEGTVDKEHSGANTILVKASDGIRHLFHVTDRTTVHGVREVDDSLNGLTHGSRVVVHYAVDGGEKTAVEVDRIADDGLREMQGVVTHIDRHARRLSIRLADGTNETLQLSERAAADLGDDAERAVDKSTVVVYYAEEGGGKVAHYFKKVGGH